MIARISREAMLLEMAYTASKRGTCGRLQVGAIISIHSRPVSLGYAGAPSGEPHCDEAACDLSKPCTRTLHAEANALRFAHNEGIHIAGADMFCTDSPCLPCAQKIVDHAIKRFYFDRPYRDPAGLIYLRRRGVEIHRVLQWHVIGSVNYFCRECKSTGFEPSITGEGCTFCDGTEGGHPPYAS